VVATGTVYRINKPANSAPGTPAACGTTRKVPDVEFSWTDADGAYHKDLQALDADDHPQYLLAGGARSAPNGFAVTGTAGAGTLAATGPGTRLLWYPRKAAFRAGRVTSLEWNDESIGIASTALGYQVVASGSYSTALGSGTSAMGNGSIALGRSAGTLGESSAALGYHVLASGDYSTALGVWASTNGQPGALVLGDASTVTYFANGYVTATAPNQLSARFAGGYRLRTSADLSTGCNLPAGSGVWECTSSRALKTGFAPVDGEGLLARVRALPVLRWSYTSEGTAVQHLGPFAEDFRAAFGLGTDSTSIGLLDAAGVGLAGVQALEARTRALQTENAALREENAALRAEVATVRAASAAESAAVRARLERLEAVLQQSRPAPRP
jgi:hypothetical protein